MSTSQAKVGLSVLQYALGVVVLIEAVRFVLPSAAHEFAHLPMPGFIRMLVGFGEIAGCILLLIPKTSKSGAWLLFAVFVLAILIHLLHGSYNVGHVVIYAAAALAIALGKS